MQTKKLRFLWNISLMAISIATLIQSGFSIIGFSLPDILVRILGILTLLALPVLVYSSIRLWKSNLWKSK